MKKLLELDVDRIVPGHGLIFKRDEAVEHAEYYLNRIKAIDDMVLNVVQKAHINGRNNFYYSH